jgi:hypothetical protein
MLLAMKYRPKALNEGKSNLYLQRYLSRFVLADFLAQKEEKACRKAARNVATWMYQHLDQELSTWLDLMS